MQELEQNIPLSLYIHIPWCIQKCPYCDFNSHKSPDTLPEEAYFRALIADLDEERAATEVREISSIFIGGGTPSLCSPEAYANLLENIQKRFRLKDKAEITLEANPGTVDQARFKAYRSLGINRLSLGIQSFNAEALKRLGRIHDDAQAHRAIEAARKAGFDNINLDIMHSLPGQTADLGLLDLKTALAHSPEHLSWYELTIEPNTEFYKKQPVLPSEDEALELEEQGLALLAAQGYQRYEISAYAKAGQQSQHNMNYWLFGDYLGIGAGAHGKISNRQHQSVLRRRKRKLPKDYLAGNREFCVENQKLGPQDLCFEFMLNTTRLEGPIERSLFKARSFLEESLLLPQLEQAAALGLITLNDQHWQITALGRRYTNDLQAIFLSY